MEDRKRPAVNSADEIAPPSKRQAVNGGSKTKEDADAKDEAWVEVSSALTADVPVSLILLISCSWPHLGLFCHGRRFGFDGMARSSQPCSSNPVFPVHVLTLSELMRDLACH